MPTRIERRIIVRGGALVDVDVELEDVPDFAAGRIHTYRTATGDLERCREMTATERQLGEADVGLRNS